jgi:hypothetical protein
MCEKAKKSKDIKKYTQNLGVARLTYRRRTYVGTVGAMMTYLTCYTGQRVAGGTERVNNWLAGT